MAVGAKLNGAIVAVVGIAVLLFQLLRYNQKNKASIYLMSSILIGSLIIFCLLDPTLYPNPIAGITAHLTEHSGVIKVQEGFLGPRLSLFNRYLTVAKITFHNPMALPAFIFLVFLIAGYSIKKGEFAEFIICAWWFISLLLVTIWIPFAIDRYIYPILLPTILIEAIALSKIVVFLQSWKDKKGKV